MRSTPHTSTNPGKRVRITLRDDGAIEGKFVEKRSGAVVLDTGMVRLKDLRQFIVVKGRGG